VLEHLRAALLALADDPGGSVLPALALGGTRPPSRQGSLAALTAEAREFASRVRAGVGGPSSRGSMLAFAVPAREGTEMVVCRLRVLPESVAAMLPGPE
jgi:hypothetical protein